MMSKPEIPQEQPKASFTVRFNKYVAGIAVAEAMFITGIAMAMPSVHDSIGLSLALGGVALGINAGIAWGTANENAREEARRNR